MPFIGNFQGPTVVSLSYEHKFGHGIDQLVENVINSAVFADHSATFSK